MEKWSITLFMFLVLIIGSEARRMASGRSASARISSRMSSAASSRTSSSSSRSLSSRSSGSSYSNSQSVRHVAPGYAGRTQNDGYQSRSYGGDSYSASSGYPKHHWSQESLPIEAFQHNPAWSQKYHSGRFSNHRFSSAKSKGLLSSSSVKMLSLGAGAGLLGGAGSGVAGYHVLQKYQQYNRIRNGQQGKHEQECQTECPPGSKCVFNICDCISGFTKQHGLCTRAGTISVSNVVGNPPSNCSDHEDCQEVDINLVCTNTAGNSSDDGKCSCRENMGWSREDNECQLMIDVDCTSLTQNIAPSEAILEAINSKLDKINEESKKNNKESDEEILNVDKSSNLMSLIDPDLLNEDDLKEAFCRDIDPNGFNFQEIRFDNNVDKKLRFDNNEEKPKKRITVSVALIITAVVILHIILILCIILGIKKTCYCCRKSRKIVKKILNKQNKHITAQPIQFSTILQSEVEEDARQHREHFHSSEDSQKCALNTLTQ